MRVGGAHRAARLGAVVAGGLATGVVAALLGVAVPFAVGLAVIVAVAGAAWAWLPIDEAAPPGPDPRSARPGTRSEVAALTWALTSRGSGVGGSGIDRVRASVRERLARHGVDLADPAEQPRLEELFGTDAWRLLTGRPGGRGERMATVEHCLDVLDRLDAEERRRS